IVYRATQAFPREELFGLTRQMRRAAISIVSNIAEGKGRNTRREYKSFLVIARGSAFELQAQAIVAADLELMSQRRRDVCVARTSQIAKMLNGIIRHLDGRPPTTQDPEPTT